jgi:inosose dehydratase
MLPASRVLPEMRSLGLDATELGAPGFLPDEAEPLAAALGAAGMSLVGGFVPLVLHDADRRADALQRAEQVARLFADCGGTRFVTAAVEDDDWSAPQPLDVGRATVLAEGLAAVDEVCDRFGLVQTLHPHVNTVVETAADVELALEHSDVRWCLDTGHLLIGGTDPVQFARAAADRVAHVHLKDVDTAVAGRVLRREVSLVDGVQQGLFRALGDGDVAVDEVVVALEERGYRGWYVLEQDTALTSGLPAEGSGPIEDVRRSLDYLERQVVPRIPAAPRL